MNLQLLTTLVFSLFCSSVFSQNLTTSVNKYSKVTGPGATISLGTFDVTVDSAQFFDVPSRALLIQMKGALASTFNGPNYGNLLNVNQAGNYEFCNIVAKNGNTITFERCLKKNYAINGCLQLITVPQYNSNQTVSKSSSISAIRIQRPGYGYVTAPPIVISPPPIGGIVATAVAILDPVTKGIREIKITNPGFGYVSDPTVTFSAAPPAPYSGTQFRPAAVAIRGLTGLQWNGSTGGVLTFEVNGDLSLDAATGDIDMTGMGFAGGSVGDAGGTINCSPSYTNYFDALSTGFAYSGGKGEGAFVVPAGHERGRGRSLNGGGAGVEGDAGGGGGGNYGFGGKGGASFQNPVTPVLPQSTCYSDTNKSGRGGITLRSVGYFWTKTNRIYLGGGGGGGHALNATANTGGNYSGGFGGGIIIIRATSITGNGRTIRANGDSAKLAVDDGGSGGGGGGVVMIDCESFPGALPTKLKLEARGGRGANTSSVASLVRTGPGGGGGGGVVWLSTALGVLPTGVTSTVNAGANGVSLSAGSNTFGALAGGVGATLYELDLMESKPYTGSVFIVGPAASLPKPNFTSLAQAADFLAFKGTDAPDITINVRTAEYIGKTIFERMSDGCAPSEGTVTVQSISGNKSDVKFSSTSDAIIVDDLPGLTLKNVTVYTDVATNIATNRAMQLINSSIVTLDNVTVQGGLELDTSGVNEATLKNTTHTGSIDVEAHAKLTLTGSTKISTKTGEATRALTMATGSDFTVNPGADLELANASWINNGANINLNGTTVKVSGTLGLTLGGTAPSTFHKLDVTNTNTITVGNTLNVEDWNQTSVANVAISTNNLNITKEITTATGKISTATTGRVICHDPLAGSVSVIGRFSNLEVNNSAGVVATGAIRIDNGLTLTDGILDMGVNLLSIETDLPLTISSLPTSWIKGLVKQKVTSLSSYNLPLGSATDKQALAITINSTSGGLQYLTTGFSNADPNTTPSFSTVNNQNDAGAYFSYVLPNGYWSLTPDAGSANYDLSLYGSFMSGFPSFTIYKRPTASTVWDLYGTLSNPAMTADFIQPDGSIRRTGLSGFSDFAVAGGEDPLPLHFIRFGARYANGGVDLNWKMGECSAGSEFVIRRGISPDKLSEIATTVAGQRQCDTHFEFADGMSLPKATRIYYQIEADDRIGKRITSPIQVVETGVITEDIPSLQYVSGLPKTFQVANPSDDKVLIQIMDMGGRTLFQWAERNGAIIDLSYLPAGTYTAILRRGDQLHRQKLLVGM